MSAIDKLLDLLNGVRQSGPGRYMACCPAHGDRSPSLSVRELDDGRILLHCFAGCNAGDVVTSLGLTLSDLMPERLGEFRPVPAVADARDALAGAAESVAVLAFIVSDIAEGKPIPGSTADLFALHAGRVLAAARAAGIDLAKARAA